MKTARIWASDDGESHVEAIELAMGSSEARGLSQSELVSAASIQVREFAPGFVTPWHAATSNAIITVWIRGSVRFETTDGGVAVLSEDGYRYVRFDDRTGKGHRLVVDPVSGVSFALIRLSETVA